MEKDKKYAIILLADGFEEIEALTCHDIFIRSGKIVPTLFSISDSLEVSTSNGLVVKADDRLIDNDPKYFDLIVLPGGKRGVDNLQASPEVDRLLKDFISNGKHVHAICAAPSILGNLGYLDGKKYTCFPGFERGKGEYIDTGVVTDGNLVTGHSMAYSLDFAEAILKLEIGEEAVKEVYYGTRGKKHA